METNNTQEAQSGSRLFLVDIEAFGASPFSGKMTEFGVVDLETRQWFRGQFFDCIPNPDLPAQPLPVRDHTMWTIGLSKYDLKNGESHESNSTKAVLEALIEWLKSLAAGRRIVLVSDNNGYDYQWVNFEFDKAGLDNPFGFSSMRIGNYAGGLTGKFANQSRWKKLRDVAHTHLSHEDSQGNAGALRKLQEAERLLMLKYPEYRKDAEKILASLKDFEV